MTSKLTQLGQLFFIHDHPASRSTPNVSLSLTHTHPFPTTTTTTIPRSHFFTHLATRINRSIFSPAHSFNQPGLYIYKRPIRSGTPHHKALLSTAGTLLHHVVIYIKTPDTTTNNNNNSTSNLIAMEFGPDGDSMADITTDIHATAPPDPIRLLNTENPELPEPHCLPMLHIDLPHHHIDAEPVVKAIKFAASKKYQVIRNNCIHFACFLVTILTGGRLRNAPLVFDVICGKIPGVLDTTTSSNNNGNNNNTSTGTGGDVASASMLDMMMGMLGMTWYDAVDGGRLVREFLEQHPDVLITPPSLASTTPPNRSRGSRRKNSHSDDDSNSVPAVLLSPPPQQQQCVPGVGGGNNHEGEEEKEEGDSDESDKTIEGDDKMMMMMMLTVMGMMPSNNNNTIDGGITSSSKQGLKRRGG